jgi:ATP-dependent RNA helicase DDX18/HAS1
LQKNYFLHQSARDAFRSYLQAYASYSLKRIFDVNALDLAKVGKAFGFSVPPRIDVAIGGGKGGAGKSGKKRRRDEEEESDEGDDDVDDPNGKDDTDEEGEVPRRSKSKARRVEVLGRQKVKKEIYRKGKDRQKMGSRGQWSR